LKKDSIVVFGTGNMGSAIISGLVKKKDFSVYAYEQNTGRLNAVIKKYRIKKIAQEELTKTCNIIIICVKPQDMNRVLEVLKPRITSRHMIISIAAGITTKSIEKVLKSKVAVVRAMPNMPGMIGRGITAYCCGRYARKKHADVAKNIFSSIGMTLFIRESKLDAVTALSGSGPGFLGYLIASFMRASMKTGLHKDEARFLWLYTIEGTARLLIESQIQPDELVKKVASPGGTTEAGLDVFKKKAIADIIEQAIKSATKKAKELSK